MACGPLKREASPASSSSHFNSCTSESGRLTHHYCPQIEEEAISPRQVLWQLFLRGQGSSLREGRGVGEHHHSLGVWAPWEGSQLESRPLNAACCPPCRTNPAVDGCSQISSPHTSNQSLALYPECFKKEFTKAFPNLLLAAMIFLEV